MASYLVYHPQRQKTVREGIVVYHDSLVGNQCPYVWNDRFLHTFCHITQMSVKEGDITFWVSGDTFPDFKHLWCDLVFCIESKLFWANANKMTPSDSIVDSGDAFRDHYSWAGRQHTFQRRRRYTLKAHPSRSWQPQMRSGNLLDLVPKLHELGFTMNRLRKEFRAGFQAKPVPITDRQAVELYSWIEGQAPIKLLGRTLAQLHRELHQNGSETQQFRAERPPARDRC